MKALNFVLIALALSTPQARAEKKQLWVYTSVYKEFIAPIEKAFEEKHPDIDVQVFQAGSEKIQAKVETELLSGKAQADLLMVSDPFWSADLEHRGLAFTDRSRKPVETNYYSAVVLISHASLPATARPRSFKDLEDTKFDKQIQIASPLESGSAFSAVALLSRKYGWEYFEKLRKNHLASNGGNSTVIQKVESGEKKIGMVLLENALAARKRGSPIEIIYPADGAFAVPSAQVILKSSPNRETALKFSDFVLSKEGQTLLRNGFMHSVRNDVAPPETAPSIKDLVKGKPEWPAATIAEIARDSKAIKKKFAELILE